MNLKLTLWVTFSVLMMMLVAGGTSARIGFLLGTEALKVVTQPETDSEQQFGKQKPIGGSHKGLKIINEKTLLIQAYDSIYKQKKQK